MGRQGDERSIDDLVWEAPPSAEYNWTAIAAQLRSNPMEWAKVGDNIRLSIVNAIRQGSIVALRRSNGFEVTTSNNKRGPERTATLFLRFNPERVTSNTKGK